MSKTAGAGMLIAAIAVVVSIAPNAALPAASAGEEDVVDDIDGVLDTASVFRALEARLGNRYAGFWIDRSADPSEYRIGVVSPTASDDILVRTLAGAGASRVTIAAVPRGREELEMLKSAAAKIVHDASLEAMVAFEIKTGAVQVITAQLPDEVRAQLQSAVPGDVLEIVEDASYRFSDFGPISRTEYPPYEAGLQLIVGPLRIPGSVGSGRAQENPAGLGECTSGFGTTWSDGIDTFNYGITAGHCGPTGTQVHVGDRYISGFGTNSYWRSNPSNSDGTRFFHPTTARRNPPAVHTGPATDDEATGLVPGHRTVRGKLQNHELGVGVRVCFQGSTSGANNCGNINRPDVSITSSAPERGGTHTVSHLWCADVAGAGGDSGGPFYHVNPDRSARAAGLVKGGGLDPALGVQITCFSSIDWLESDLNVTLTSG